MKYNILTATSLLLLLLLNLAVATPVATMIEAAKEGKKNGVDYSLNDVKLCYKKINSRVISISTAYCWWKIGKGKSVHIDSSRLRFKVQSITKQGTYYTVSVKNSYGGDFEFDVHGTINLVLQKDGTFKGKTEPFDWDQRKDRSKAKNIETYIGSKIFGRGTSFSVIYDGKITRDQLIK